MDIEFIILDDKGYNESKFNEVISNFNPVVIINGTEIPLLLSRPQLKSVGFSAPVLCVNGTCYKEADLPPPASPTPAPTPAPAVEESPNTDLLIVATSVGVVTMVILIGMCW